MSPDVQTLLNSGAALTDAALERLLPSTTTPPHSIHRAMRHSTFAGGKRLRPILCMEAARMMGAPFQPGAPEPALSLPKGPDSRTWDSPANLPPGAADLGAAIEMVHTYSLIHDDLPALDNDDLRRGKPTCHVVFGEAIAILAGDALQTLAFQTISQLPAPPSTIVEILREFSLAIGTGVGPSHSEGTTMPGAPFMAQSYRDMSGAQQLPHGMIGGQVVDIESEGHQPTADLVERIHRSKTGALITASIVCGGLLGLAHAPIQHSPSVQDLRTFGEKAGLAFQIVDDILDVTQTSAELGKTAGKDTASDKATWPAVFGIERSRHDASALIADAFQALEPFGPAANPLKSLAQYLVDRTH